MGQRITPSPERPSDRNTKGYTRRNNGHTTGHRDCLFSFLLANKTYSQKGGVRTPSAVGSGGLFGISMNTSVDLRRPPPMRPHSRPEHPDLAASASPAEDCGGLQ